jgi:hypothetical protein
MELEIPLPPLCLLYSLAAGSIHFSISENKEREWEFGSPFYLPSKTGKGTAGNPLGTLT